MSLNSFSARMNPATPSNATAEGTHIRCFERATACAMPYGCFVTVYDAAQQILEYYKARGLLPQPTTSVRVRVPVCVCVCVCVRVRGVLQLGGGVHAI